MANSLLDFVMSLVRDPDAAAQYAADPAQAIAAANLTDVTSVDVDHLIPVVAESLSTVVPFGVGSGAVGSVNPVGSFGDVLDSAHNVWTSGAATAAFDAFDDHLPIQGVDVAALHTPTTANVIEQPDDLAPTIVDHGFDHGFDNGLDDLDVPAAAAADPSSAHDVPTYEDVHALGGLAEDALHDHLADHQALSTVLDDHPDFDAFT